MLPSDFGAYICLSSLARKLLAGFLLESSLISLTLATIRPSLSVVDTG